MKRCKVQAVNYLRKNAPELERFTFGDYDHAIHNVQYLKVKTKTGTRITEAMYDVSLFRRNCDGFDKVVDFTDEKCLKRTKCLDCLMSEYCKTYPVMVDFYTPKQHEKCD